MFQKLSDICAYKYLHLIRLDMKSNQSHKILNNLGINIQPLLN